MSRGGDLACKVYVGDLLPDTSEKELEREFEYYGKLKSVWVARNPSGFAFIEFEDSRDAEDAIVGLDGKTVCGSRVRVEKSSGKRKTKPWERDSYGDRDRGRGPPPSRYGDRRAGGKPFDPNDECYKCGDRGHYAYDCRGGGGGRRGRSRSRSRDRYRGRSRSVSRDRSYRRDSRDRSRSRGRY